MNSKKYNIIESLVPCANITITILLTKINKDIYIDNFLDSYKVSNFWKGKFFIKRLIKKVFKYNLKENFKWNKHFWDIISIELFESKIILNDNIDYFNEKVNKYIIPNRLKDITKYKNLLLQGYDLGCPLYISSNSLNYLGADLKEDCIFILDGSRRLVSYASLEINPQILLINIK